MDDIFISVIITAYNRKEFLLNAVKSALNQTLDKKYYEIIVIKNYSDDKIDKFIKENNIKNILTDEISLSGKIVEAFKIAKGDIISFLEDDDTFLENKLENVVNRFSDPSLVYYHNNYSIINENAERLDINLPYQSNSKCSIKVDTKDLDIKKLRALNKNNGFFNLSCISIRKSLVSWCLDKLDRINVALDYFFFFQGIDSDGVVFIDNKVLTLYRVHKSNDSLAVATSKKIFCENKINFFKEDLIGFTTIQSLSRHEIVKKYLSCRILIPQIALYIFIHKTRPIITVRCSLLCSIKIQYIPLFVLSILYGLEKLFPGIGISFLYKYENAKIGRINKKDKAYL